MELEKDAPSKIVRDMLEDSVDTVHLVVRLNKIPPADALKKRGFRSKPGKFDNSITWFLNPKSGNYKPNLTIYEHYGPGYSLRVNASLPKLVHGNNLDLVSDEEIDAALEQLSDYVSDATGLAFDAGKANVARIDYATNIEVVPKAGSLILRRLRRIKIPRLPFRADISIHGSVYHGNRSRMLRFYDKTHEAGRVSANTMVVRAELAISNEGTAVRFAEKAKLRNHAANSMLDKAVRGIAIDEIFKLTKLESFDPAADFSLLYFYSKTQNFARARRNSSFVNAYDTFGPDFYKFTELGYSKARYDRELREAQAVGF